MRKKSGFALILVILALLALFTLLSAGLLFVSLGSGSRALALERGSQAAALAEGCMDEALNQVRLDEAYAGGVVDLEGVVCVVEVNSGSEQSSATATIDLNGHVRRVTTTFTRTVPALRVLSWSVE